MTNYEEHVIASLMTGDIISYSAVAEIIDPNMFENKYYRYIYATIQKINQSKGDLVDYITVLEYAMSDDRLTQHQRQEIFFAVNILMDKRFIGINNYKYYVTKFMEQVKRKELNLLGKVITDTDRHNITDFIEEVKTKLNKIQEKNIVNTLSTSTECSTELLTMIDEFDPDKIIKTGFDIDYLTGGFREKQLIIISARPRMGKTALALSTMLNMAKRDKKVIYYSMEMDRKELFARMTATRTHINLESIMNPNRLTEQETVRVAECQKYFSELPIYISDTGYCSPSRIEADINKQAMIGMKPDIVIVDGIELVQGDQKRYNSPFEKVSDISGALKNLAMSSGVPIIVCCQLNRNCEERKNKRPELYDLRMTGNLEQDANIVIMLYRDEVYNPETTDEPGICEVFIRKNRNGKEGMKKLFYRAEYTEFSNIQPE